MGPLFAAHGWSVEVLDRDTDALGTFSGDVERHGTPLEVAIAKARLARDECPEGWWVASEGSLGVDAFGVTFDHEIVVMVDASTGVTLVGEALRYDVVLVGRDLESPPNADQIREVVARAGVPHHRLMVVSLDHDVAARGGLRTIEEVEAALREMSAPGRRLRLQSDCRAHFSPSRQRVIAEATQSVLRHWATPCPRCEGPGFAVTEVVAGRQCARCGRETDEARAEVWRCPWCQYWAETLLSETGADPANCPWCNP